MKFQTVSTNFLSLTDSKHNKKIQWTILKRTSIALLLLTNHPALCQSLFDLDEPFGMEIPSETMLEWRTNGTSLALPAAISPFGSNPASSGFVKNLAYATSAFTEIAILKDGENNTSSVDFHPHTIQVAVPLGRLGVVSGSFKRYKKASVDLRMLTPVQLSLEEAVDTVEYHIHASRWQRGFELGWSIPFKNSSIGLFFKRTYIDVVNKNAITYPGIPYNTMNDSTVSITANNSLRTGLFSGFGKFTLGVAGEYSFHSESETTYMRTDGDMVYSEKSEFSFPPSAGIGIACQLNTKLILAGDLDYRFWKFFHIINDRHITPKTYRNAAVNVSMAILFNLKPQTDNQSKSPQLSGGLRLTQLPQPEKRDFAVAAGAQYPLWKIGALQSGLQYVIRTDGEYENYREHFWNIAFGYSGEVKLTGKIFNKQQKM